MKTMKEWAAPALVLPVALALLTLIALLPVLIQASGDSIVLQWGQAWDVLISYISGLFTGESFQFKLVATEHSFFDQIGSYASNSLMYLAFSSLIGVTIGIFGGIWLARVRSEAFKQTLEALSVLPDFVVIVILQVLVVTLYKNTGFLIAQVASFSEDSPAILLPILSMVIIPALYIMRNIAVHTYQVLTEEYILNAKAKGMPKLYIFMKHALPNVLPFLRAELHKVVAIIMGNLFITEYLYNVKGVTKLLFSSGLALVKIGRILQKVYQFNLIMNCFILLVVLYLLVYLIIRIYVRLMERVVVGE